MSARLPAEVQPLDTKGRRSAWTRRNRNEGKCGLYDWIVTPPGEGREFGITQATERCAEFIPVPDLFMHNTAQSQPANSDFPMRAIVHLANGRPCRCQTTARHVEQNVHWPTCIVGQAQEFLGRKVSFKTKETR